MEKSNRELGRNRKIGYYWLIIPILVVFINDIIARIVVTIMYATTGSIPPNIGRIVNISFGLIGSIAVICTLIGIPLGIYFLRKK